MTKAKEQYTDDAPIASKEGDRFNRWPFAERIANVIATRTDPSSLVLGLYGPWGDGKTSVLNMMAEALASHDAVILVPFNPWHFEDEQQLIRAFFDTLAESLQKKLTTRGEDIGKFLGKYGGLLSLASVSLSGVATLSPGKAAAEMGDKLSTVTIDELKRRLSDLLFESGKRVVVLIDDIDRLDRREIHALLKLIKLSASFSNTAYVLALDDDMVSAALGERYGRGDIGAGRQFLEKIIQVPLHCRTQKTSTCARSVLRESTTCSRETESS